MEKPESKKKVISKESNMLPTDDLYQIAETLPGPYLELFARKERQGWDSFGNEIQNSISLSN